MWLDLRAGALVRFDVLWGPVRIEEELIWEDFRDDRIVRWCWAAVIQAGD